MYSLRLNILGLGIYFETNSSDLFSRMRGDFEYFLDDKKEDIFIRLFSYQERAPFERIPPLVAAKQSDNSITYNDGRIRYNDYYGEALSIFHYEKEEAYIYAEEINLLHEISYLLILSRTGKKSDRNGFHKLHACALEIDGKAVIIALPSKGGKSTLFKNLMNREGVKMISDDTPVINWKGQIFPFPLRVGFEHEPEGKTYATLERKKHGLKFLVSPYEYSPVHKDKIYAAKETIFIHGFRTRKEKPKLSSLTILSAFKRMISHGVIGVGLPMVIEYFLESTPKDWVINGTILVKRSVAFFILACRAKSFDFYMTNNPKNNADYLYEKIKRLS